MQNRNMNAEDRKADSLGVKYKMFISFFFFLHEALFLPKALEAESIFL